MEEKLAELYKGLAEKITSMIPTQWNQLYYLGEVEKGKQSWSSVFYFTDESDGKTVKSHDIPAVYNVSQQSYSKLLSEVSSLLIALYDCFAANEQELWEQVSFVLSNNGKFKVDFTYNVMHEKDGGQSMRELIWAYETFGFVPREGSRSKKMLDNYLREK